MRIRLMLAAGLAALTAMLALASTATAAPASSEATAAAAAPITVPITGTATNALGQVVNFAGNFTLTGFQATNGGVAAVGTLTGTLTNTVTGVVQNVTQQVVLPITGAQAGASCTILHLELGPLDLNLLGLMVHLDRVVLDISAQPGPGNLLGNLLCAVAHLLDNTNASGNAVANLLNRILGLLG